ncbi:hypothetical protein TARUN_8027 [Trichoderma arundinaceum]|uniref:Subtilisin-like serine protease n=1 Tax=Trichoderma arundinaceum TaxID=490622 RepID=A0A395NDN3_TRIAR|nr:hypothetical protein TARUN_8027 [Trichoderma arundinaceum]
MPDTNFQVPFPESCALNKDRLCLPSHILSSSSSPHSDQEADYINYLPGYPAVCSSPDEIYEHLARELETPLLDELYEKLWLVGRRAGHHIDALHAQKVKGRTIIPVEDPRLHLIWDHSKVYIKPIPILLLNHEVWETCLSPVRPRSCEQNSVASFESATMAFHCSTAVGFLRSYSFLISHPLDLAIAQESYLIPQNIDWVQWSRFISHFRHVGDENVAGRYHYGQLRLSRLNWVVRVFRPMHAHNTWFYELPHWSISEFMVNFTLPIAFIFATISLVLSSMQVALSIPVDVLWFEEPGNYQQAMGRAFWMFSIMVVLLWALVSLLLLGIPLLSLGWQFSWGYRHRKQVNVQGSYGSREP